MVHQYKSDAKQLVDHIIRVDLDGNWEGKGGRVDLDGNCEDEVCKTIDLVKLMHFERWFAARNGQFI